MRSCNKVVEYACSTSNEGFYCAADGIDWDECVVCTITDASFANETEVVNQVTEGYRSQQGHIICLAPGDVINAAVTTIHPIAWSSTVIRRVCRSTLQAETMSLSKGVESGTRLRAAIVDMRGQLDIGNWEESASEKWNIFG